MTGKKFGRHIRVHNLTTGASHELYCGDDHDEMRSLTFFADGRTLAAGDPDEGGVISPGGVGYDINCGVRLVKTNLYLDDVKHRMKELVRALFYTVPTGAGRDSRIRVSTSGASPSPRATNGCSTRTFIFFPIIESACSRAIFCCSSIARL